MTSALTTEQHPGRCKKVRAGFYRCGPFCIHKGPYGWSVYRGPKPLFNFMTLRAAKNWAEASQ